MSSSNARIALVCARIGWGSLLLISPDTVLAEAPGSAPPGVRSADRLLGIRHLIEGAVLARHARAPAPSWSIGIDALHGASMLGLAAARPGLRRDALRSAASAGTLVALSLWERRGGRT
jgi:hypothetical protein